MVTSGAACSCDQKKSLEKRSHLYNSSECEGAQSIGVGWGGVWQGQKRARNQILERLSG